MTDTTDMWIDPTDPLKPADWYRWMTATRLQRSRWLRIDRIVRRDQRRRNRQAMRPLKWTGREALAIRRQAHEDWLLMKDLWD